MGFWWQNIRKKKQQQAAPAATAAPDPQIAQLKGVIRDKTGIIGGKDGVIARKEADILTNQETIARIQNDLLSETLTSAERLSKINELNFEIVKLNDNIKQLEVAYQTLITDYTTLSTNYTSLNSDYDTALDNEKNMQIELYKNIMNQNMSLEKESDKIRGEHTADFQKVNYQSDQNTSLNGITNVLWIIYYTIVIFLLCILIFIEKTMTVSMKILIIVICCLYPYVINVIEMYLYRIYDYLYSIININAYTNDY